VIVIPIQNPTHSRPVSSFRAIPNAQIENGIVDDSNRLHQKKHFAELLKTSPQIPEKLIRLLGFNRTQIEALQRIDRSSGSIFAAKSAVSRSNYALAQPKDARVDGGWLWRSVAVRR
jgi:hypothetical protein